MSKMNLEQDLQRFAQWRSKRQKREPIPDDLWMAAGRHIAGLGISRVARTFHLNDTKLREKARQAGIVLPITRNRKNIRSEKPAVAFQEVLFHPLLVPPPATSSLILERPDGMRVRIEGQLPDPEYVGKLAACFLREVPHARS